MGCGASSAERLEGTAVTGSHRCKVMMPEGVVGEQIEGGWKPGKRMQRFTPTNLEALLNKQGANDLYKEFEAVIARDCGGSSMTGWNSSKVRSVKRGRGWRGVRGEKRACVRLANELAAESHSTAPSKNTDDEMRSLT